MQAGTGAGRIVSVTNANQIVIDTTASGDMIPEGACLTVTGGAFDALSYTYNGHPDTRNILIPGPAPGDNVGADQAPYLTGPWDDYLAITQAATVLAKDQGLTNGAAACSAALAFTGGVVQQSKAGWYIKPRGAAC